MNRQLNILKNIKGLVGNTPLLEIIYQYKNKERRVYAKLEYYNVSGSIKDRVALKILGEAYSKGIITPEHIIVEATSGNTGIAFSAFGAMLGNHVRIYMPDFMSSERIQIIKSYNAEICLVSREQGGFLGSIARAEQEGKDNNLVFLPKQFENPLNTLTHYETTGKEIAAQLEGIGLKADGVVAGVGTGGTVAGIGKRLKEINSKAMVFPLEPENSPTLSTGKNSGDHRIAGIGDEFIPQILKDNYYDKIVGVDDGDAINMSRRLAKEFGIGVGISSGANFLGAVMANEMLGEKSVITTVFADDNKKYLTTDYSNPQKEQENHLSPKIQLKGYNIIRA